MSSNELEIRAYKKKICTKTFYKNRMEDIQ
jgi:hypothetical protein